MALLLLQVTYLCFPGGFCLNLRASAKLLILAVCLISNPFFYVAIVGICLSTPEHQAESHSSKHNRLHPELLCAASSITRGLLQLAWSLLFYTQGNILPVVIQLGLQQEVFLQVEYKRECAVHSCISRAVLALVVILLQFFRFFLAIENVRMKLAVAVFLLLIAAVANGQGVLEKIEGEGPVVCYDCTCTVCSIV